MFIICISTCVTKKFTKGTFIFVYVATADELKIGKKSTCVSDTEVFHQTSKSDTKL